MREVRDREDLYDGLPAGEVRDALYDVRVSFALTTMKKIPTMGSEKDLAPPGNSYIPPLPSRALQITSPRSRALRRRGVRKLIQLAAA